MAAKVPVAGVSLAGNTPGSDDSVTILTDHATLIDANTAGIATLQSHGASVHTDVTRQFFVPAGAGSVSDDTNLISSSVGPVYAFPDAGTETVAFSFWMPNNWVSSMSYQIYWVPAATVASSAVRWSANYLWVAVGGDISAAGTTAAFTGASSAHTVNLVYAESAQTIATGEAASRMLRFSLSRVGGNAADTYTNDAQLIGILFSYTANQ